jgi:hypothetical protein
VAGLTLQQQRNWLVGVAATAILSLAVSLAVAFVDPWTEAFAGRPDYYRILLDEMARQHYFTTGTVTIVKEAGDVMDLFGRQYNLRNQRYGFPETSVAWPEKSVLAFTYVPGGGGLSALPLEEMAAKRKNPTLTFTEGSLQPVAIWVYSAEQRLLACVFYDLADEETLRNPGLRFFQTIDAASVTRIYGPFSFADSKVTPTAAYLVPLGDLKLENLGPLSKEDPSLQRLDFALPLLVDSSHVLAMVPPRFTDQNTIARLRQQAMAPFRSTRSTARWLALPICLSVVVWSWWRLARLRQYHHAAIASYLVPGQETPRIGPLRFLLKDLNAQMWRRMNEPAALKYQTIARERVREREVDEIAELHAELLGHRERPELPTDLADRIDQALPGGSLSELRLLVGECRRFIGQRRALEEAKDRRVRDWEREIQRLQRELEAVPPDKRGEAKEAWTLYLQAQAVDDLKERLHWLKEARKRLPKQFRPEPF